MGTENRFKKGLVKFKDLYDYVKYYISNNPIISANKGWFANPTALTTAYPTGQNGWYAIVGSTDTVWVWDADTSAWVDTGETAMGDVVGPASSTNNNVAVFDGTTGKLIKDGGATLASKQDQDNLLDSISTLSSNGIIVRQNANDAETRSIVAGSAKITVSNGDGVSGNPTINLGSVSISDITNLQANLDAKLSLSGGTMTGDILFGAFADLAANTLAGLVLKASSGNPIITLGENGDFLKLNQLTNGPLFVDSNGLVSKTKTPNNQTGTTYTLNTTDNGGIITANNASAQTYTIPVSTTLGVGYRTRVINVGAGTISFVKAAGSADVVNGNDILISGGAADIEVLASGLIQISFSTAVVNLPSLGSSIVNLSGSTPLVVHHCQARFTLLSITVSAGTINTGGTFKLQKAGLVAGVFTATDLTANITPVLSSATYPNNSVIVPLTAPTNMLEQERLQIVGDGTLDVSNLVISYNYTITA